MTDAPTPSLHLILEALLALPGAVNNIKASAERYPCDTFLVGLLVAAHEPNLAGQILEELSQVARPDLIKLYQGGIEAIARMLEAQSAGASKEEGYQAGIEALFNRTGWPTHVD